MFSFPLLAKFEDQGHMKFKVTGRQTVHFIFFRLKVNLGIHVRQCGKKADLYMKLQIK